MKILVVGLGETGRALVKLLNNTEHEVIVIDKNRECVDTVTDRYKVNGIVGSGASCETLKKAGADTADILIALTPVDEINLLSCMQAKNIGTTTCVARVLMPDLVKEEEQLIKDYNIDYLIKPRMDLAEEIFRNIGLPGHVKLESSMDDEISVIDINVLSSSPLAGLTISGIKEAVDADMMIGVIVRNDHAIKPRESTVINENDGLYVITKKEHLDETLDSLGVKRKRINDAVIVGGGIAALYLARKMTAAKIRLTIIDDDLDRCRMLMDEFPNARIAYAEGDITEVLEEERVDKADAVISLTGNDETNLVVSMFSWAKGIKSIITRVDKQVHVKLLHKVNIDITVSPTEISVYRIMRYIGSIANPETDEDSQIMEFIGNLRSF